MIADNLATYLQAQIPELVKGKNLFVGNAPSSPANCVIIYDTGGAAPYQEIPIDHPTVQILCRGKKNEYVKTKETAMDIYNLINRKQNTIIDTVDTLFIQAIQTPQSLGLKEKDRWEVSTNYLFKLRNHD